MNPMQLPPIIRLGAAALITLCAVSCSKNSLPPNAHVEDLGVLHLTAQTPKQMPLPGDPSLYCVTGRPEQMAQKVELSITATQLPDASLRLALDIVPTPADYHRLSLKHAEMPFKSGSTCWVKAGENTWLKFTPTLDVN